MPEKPRPSVGQPVPRIEDYPLIRGQGRYVGDFHEPQAWVVSFVRSSHAHAKITAIDTSQAEKLPGVHAVLTAAAVTEMAGPMPGDAAPAQPPLAHGRVLYVGQPVVAIAADNRYIAEDAADLVTIEYDPLPPIASIDEALSTPVLLHPALGSNEAGSVEESFGRGASALADADLVIEERLSMGRVSAQPMEPRGIFCRCLADGSLEIQYATQSVFGAQKRIAEFLQMDPKTVRVMSPDVGGGFGAKNGAYPEEFVVAWLSHHFQKPAKWNGDRFEEFLGTTHEREQVHHAKLGLKRDGTIVALVDTYYQDNGAYPNRGDIPFRHTAANLIGPYVIPHVEIHGHMMLTSKVPQAPYRGAGRPQGHFVIERLLDRAADALEMDRVAIRRQNLVTTPSADMHAHYDSGDFAQSLDRLVEAINLGDFRERQVLARRQKRYLGLGIADCVEISAGGGFEGARLTLLGDGRVQLGTGSVAHGQGHQTSLAQIVSQALGIGLDQVVVAAGDTASVGRGIGTFGSRTMVMAGNAAQKGSDLFMAALKEKAAERLEAGPVDLVWQDGRFSVRGVPAVSLSLSDLAQYQETPITIETYYQSQASAYGFGAHAALVEVDLATMAIRVLDYVIVHDGGRIINPLLADGQVVGATVQGLGTALFEEMIYDAEGQPLSTSFLDYVLPGAVESPDITIIHANYPAPGNPGGIKGVGEAGIIPSQAVVLSAVEDALSPFHVRLNHAPITPARLFSLLKTKGTRS